MNGSWSRALLAALRLRGRMPHIRYVFFGAGLCSLIAYEGLLGGATAACESFTFVQGQRPVATLVIGSRAQVEEDLHFAKILASTIKQISGVDIPIADKDCKVQTPGQVLIGTPDDIPLLKKLLTEDTSYQKQIKTRHGKVPLPASLGRQGFIIHKTKKQHQGYLVLTGHTDLAVLYAVNTLDDRLHVEADRVVVDGLGTDSTPVVNIPAFKYRSLFTSVGPGGLATDEYAKEFGNGSGDTYREFVDWLASHKINNVLLMDTSRFKEGLCYDSKAFPELVNRKHPNVKCEYIRDIITYGCKRGVTVFLMHNLPDNWDLVIKKYRELYGINLGGKASTVRGYNIADRTACLNKPEVKKLWDAYWNEVLDRYPDVEAVGAQFGESRRRWCQCSFCTSERFFETIVEYYDSMVSIARSKNRAIKSWIFTVPGARDIIAKRASWPNLIVIDWGVEWLPFALGRKKPRGDWYLYHRYGDNPEFGTKHMCLAMQAHGIEGMQIRAIEFKAKDRVFQHFEEFTWNPGLSIEDYAQIYVTKILRRKHESLAKAYGHYILAQGYREISSEGGASVDSSAKRKTKWLNLDNCDRNFESEVHALNATLDGIRADHPFVDWLRDRAVQLAR